MYIIKYPEKYQFNNLGHVLCFMAGGCGDTKWREIFLDVLNQHILNHLVIFDPYNDNITSTFSQIEWEYYHLNNFINRNFIFSVYFDKYTTQAISMFELGKALALCQPCFVKVETGATQTNVVQNYGFPVVISMHEDSPVKQDLICQCGLMHKEAKVRTPEEHALEVIKVYKDIRHQGI